MINDIRNGWTHTPEGVKVLIFVLAGAGLSCFAIAVEYAAQGL